MYIGIKEDGILPIFIKHPKDQSKVYGEEVTLSVSTTDVGALTYQWIKDENIIESSKFNGVGARTSTLYIGSFLPEHVGNYKCCVSNDVGSVESNCAQIKGNYNII